MTRRPTGLHQLGFHIFYEQWKICPICGRCAIFFVFHLFLTQLSWSGNTDGQTDNGLSRCSFCDSAQSQLAFPAIRVNFLKLASEALICPCSLCSPVLAVTLEQVVGYLAFTDNAASCSDWVIRAVASTRAQGKKIWEPFATRES